MKVIGLTGGIGMGKSTAAAAFRRARIPVFDADAAVHQLQAKGGRAVRPIEAAFPGTIKDGAVDRTALRARRARQAGGDTATRTHPASDGAGGRGAVSSAAPAAPASRAAVLDIPLLFETGRERKVHKIVVVSAPRSVQIHRVRRRRRMSEADIGAIIARQMPDAEKRRRADIVIRTGLSRYLTNRQMRRLIMELLK